LTGDADHDREILAQPVSGGNGESLGVALMAPHRSFLQDVLPHTRAGRITGMAHITGGGLIDNAPRMLPPETAVRFDRKRWQVPAVFLQLVQMGDVHPSEYHRVLNMGIGFVLAVRAADADSILTAIPESVVIGSIVPIGSDGRRVLGLD
jgi:phosphoribosylformylglycinamidine cyclo-ligase